MEKGFYFAYEQDEIYGFALSIVYNAADKDFQISLQISNLTLAIGYKF